MTVDVNASISKAYDSSLSDEEQQFVREHLSYILAKLREPHAQIEPIKAALLALDARIVQRLPWFQRPIGIIMLAVIGSVIAAGLAKQLGWI
ncbi:hypothetical protein [Herbaspirillum sp. C7C8]|uniref:hypothetical protein n=1 Tax=Herbaspirillum sp. C7C8 TaxID=2736665 RepID=UPI001F521F0B|nr:hypothetical protein [Herbaspirillum sp. C7C8]MCI1003286.1 hypothetical protein [Herbaspirillum sp. C7C8]